MARVRKSAYGSSLPDIGDLSSEARGSRKKEVLEAILGAIASGRLRGGDRLPTEAELCKTFSASRTTISKAMRELKSRGVLDRRRGGGTRITQQDSRRIALFAPFAGAGNDLGYTGGMIYTQLAELASRRADDLSLQVLDRSKGDRLDQMLAAVDEMVGKGIKGVFYYPLELTQETAHYNQLVVDKMRSAGLAVVLVDRDIVTFPRRSDLELVTYDNYRGGYLACDHIIRQGCRRVAFIGIPFASSAVSDRLRGYYDALEDHEIHRDPALVKQAVIEELTFDFCQALMLNGKPDAIICKMDHFAAIVGRHLVEMGLKIGRDVMLAGFDDQPIAELLPVPLTTIHFPTQAFVNVCYDRLVKRLEEPAGTDSSVTVVDVELVLRASTAGRINETQKSLAQPMVIAG